MMPWEIGVCGSYKLQSGRQWGRIGVGYTAVARAQKPSAWSR